MQQTTVELVEPRTQRFDEVLALYRRHSVTLGFLPRGAFDEFAAAGRLLAAVRDRRTVAYVTWRVTVDEATLVHLCVDAPARGQGVARTLMGALFDRTRDLAAIRLSCRKDFDATNVWPRFGFIADRERPGRGTDRAPLVVWRRTNGDGPPLLALLKQATPRASRVAAIDANVFFDLIRTGPHSEESGALLADWIDDVDLCVTAELNNEITRQDDPAAREHARRALRLYKQLEARPDALHAMVERVSAVLPPVTTPSDESDRRQLAHAVLDGAGFFITRDQLLLDHAADLEGTVGIEVLRPCNFIVRLQEEGDEAGYAPVRLAGTKLERRPVRAEADLHPFQRFARAESKSAWLSRVRGALAAPDRHRLEVIGAPGEPPRVALGVDLGEPNALRILFARALSGSLTPTILRRALADVVQEAMARAEAGVISCDDIGDPLVDAALADLGFQPFGGGVAKRVLRAIVSASEADQVVSRAFPTWPAASVRADCADQEGTLWPLKVLDAGLPTYIVPIRPDSAAALFDARLAQARLFGVPEQPALALENVYYSASVITIPPGARILWYVSGDVKQVRACSLSLGTDVASAHTLSKRYYRLGTYRWAEILAMTGGDPHGELRAYRFHLTEPFGTPLGFHSLQRVLERHNGHGNQIASPVCVPEPVFADIYRMGIQRA